ncbi:MAG: hypothetical protein ACXW00_03960 [Methylobacter sp.]
MVRKTERRRLLFEKVGLADRNNLRCLVLFRSLRLRVVHAVESGQTTREVDALVEVSPGFVSRVHQLWRHTCGVQTKPIGGYRRAILEPYADDLIEQLSKSPSMILKELQSWLESDPFLPISIAALDKFLSQKLGYCYKKTWSPLYSSAKMSPQPVINGRPGKKLRCI